MQQPERGIAFFANRGAAPISFALVLALIFLVAFAGNEAVAHLVFGTCLYGEGDLPQNSTYPLSTQG